MQDNYVLIGRNRVGEKLYVRARLEHPADRAGNPWRESVNHEQTTDRLRLSITGVQIGKYGSFDRNSAWLSCGQVEGELLNLTRLELGWTVGSVSKLHEMWKRWHLNDMRAACAHQTVRQQQVGGGLETNVADNCPETGYRYGSSWLVESLPHEVWTWVCETFDVEIPTPGVTTPGVTR